MEPGPWQNLCTVGLSMFAFDQRLSYNESVLGVYRFVMILVCVSSCLASYLGGRPLEACKNKNGLHLASYSPVEGLLRRRWLG